MTFEAARVAELPPWVGGAVFGDGTVDTGVEQAAVAGRMQDAEHATLKAGVGARFLGACPDDALDEYGVTVQIPRFQGESNATYRARLGAAWETWELAGTAPGIVSALNAYGIEDVEVVEDWQGHWGESQVSSHFHALLGPTLPWAPRLAPFLGGPTTCGGSTATPGEVAAVKALVLQWKAPHSYPMAVRLLFAGTIHGGPSLLAPFVTGTAGAVEWRIDKTAPQTGPFVAGGYDT